MISLVSPDICITYVYIDIYIYIVQRICASEGQIASSIRRIDFPEVPLITDVKQSIQSRWDKNSSSFLQLAPGIQSEIWTENLIEYQPQIAENLSIQQDGFYLRGLSWKVSPWSMCDN